MNKKVAISSITKKFGHFFAVDDVSLNIRGGELITLLGPSGSGKTTLLLLVAGFHKASSGEILIGDNPMALVPPNKRNIGMVFQNYALFPHMTVESNIAYSLKIRGLTKQERKKKVFEALELVKLAEFADRYPEQLSGGQQQRVALARALVYDPSVVLMDEPLGALDKKLRDYMQLEIKRIQETLNMTMIYVTHDQEEALTISDRIAVMNHGKIAQVDTPEELYLNPNSTFVADFIGDSNILTGKVIGIEQSHLMVDVSAPSPLMVEKKTRLGPGQRVDITIRPESFYFIDDTTNDNEVNNIECVVRKKIYLGDSIKYVVDANNGHEIVIKKQHSPTRPIKKRGEKVMLGCYPKDIKIFLGRRQ